jgi:hypothetical protein
MGGTIEARNIEAGAEALIITPQRCLGKMENANEAE